MLGADGFPVDQAERVSSGEALPNGRGCFMLANLSDKVSPSCGVDVHRNEIRSKRVELGVRVGRLTIIGWIEPSRLRCWARFVCHVLFGFLSGRGRSMRDSDSSVPCDMLSTTGVIRYLPSDCRRGWARSATSQRRTIRRGVLFVRVMSVDVAAKTAAAHHTGDEFGRLTTAFDPTSSVDVLSPHRPS